MTIQVSRPIDVTELRFTDYYGFNSSSNQSVHRLALAVCSHTVTFINWENKKQQKLDWTDWSQGKIISVLKHTLLTNLTILDEAKPAVH